MQLNLLGYSSILKLKDESGSKMVWDNIRKKWVRFTPEEMVRQLFIHYLIEILGVSKGQIAVEKEIQLGKKTKRCDLIVFNAYQQPEIVIECKSPDVKLDDKVIAQAVRYNQSIEASQLGIVNGIEYLVFAKGIGGKYEVQITTE